MGIVPIMRAGCCGRGGGRHRVELSPGDVVIVDQVIDYTWGRAHTFSGSAGVLAGSVRKCDPRGLYRAVRRGRSRCAAVSSATRSGRRSRRWHLRRHAGA